MKAKVSLQVLALLLFLVFICLSQAFAGQFGPVSGLVLDAETLQPIEGAKISIERKVGNKVEVDEGTTSADGKYKFNTAIVKVGVSMSFNVLNPLVGKTLENEATLYGSSALLFGIPVKGYESLFFYTQAFSVKVEKEGYKTFAGNVTSYDFNASFKNSYMGTYPGSAVLDDIVLAKADSKNESKTVEKYLTISDLTIEPNSAAPGEVMTISAKYNMAPDMKKWGGKLLAVVEIGKKVIKVELKDDGNTKNGDKQKEDLIFSGQLKVDKKAKPGEYKIYAFADGRPRGKRNQDAFGIKGKQMAARNILEGDFTVK